jgi:retinol dehydrogenase-12
MSSPAPGFIRSQYKKLPYPTKKFTGQTIIITGSNVGMGLEAARHFVRLDAEKVILAVRTISKGETAKKSIGATTNRQGVIEVWELDLAEYASVISFTAKAQELERLDVVIANAGMYTFDFQMAEGNERTITVNVVSTFLLSLLLIPKLRETAIMFKKTPVLSLTGSFVHFGTPFPERNNENIFQELSRRETARMDDRYVYPHPLIYIFGPLIWP